MMTKSTFLYGNEVKKKVRLEWVNHNIFFEIQVFANHFRTPSYKEVLTAIRSMSEKWNRKGSFNFFFATQS